MLHVVDKFKNYDWLLISILFVLFSLGGVVFGMCEETIPLMILMVPVFIKIGLDSVTAMLTIYVATQIGFASSWMNPFNVIIAQGISGVPVLSGSVFRMLMWVFFTIFGLVFTLFYARKIKKNIKSSITYEIDKLIKFDLKKEHNPLKIGHILVICSLMAGVVWIVWGVIAKQYYIPEIATQFFILGFVSGLIAIFFKLNNMTFNKMASAFRVGAADLLPAALVVGFAKGIVILLGGDNPESASVLNTLLYYSGELIKDLPTMKKICEEVVKAVKIPVTAKTRIGWDFDSITVIETLKIFEDSGIRAMTLHPRTRNQKFKGLSDWNYIKEVKKQASIPIIGNGDIVTPYDALRMFEETNCDGIMIGREAINNPWIFKQIKEYLATGTYEKEIQLSERIEICLKHFDLACKYKGDKRAQFEMRKLYNSYFKGIPHIKRFKRLVYSTVEVSKIKEYITNIDTIVHDRNIDDMELIPIVKWT